MHNNVPPSYPPPRWSFCARSHLLSFRAGIARAGPVRAHGDSFRHRPGSEWRQLHGVTVTTINLDTGASRSVSTNGDGRWTIPGLQSDLPGNLRAGGFQEIGQRQNGCRGVRAADVGEKLEIGRSGAVVNIVEGSALVATETATTFRQLSPKIW